VVAGVLGAAAVFTHMVGVALIPALAAGALFARGAKRTWLQRLVAALIVGALTTAAAAYWLHRGANLPHLANYVHHVRLADSQPLQYQLFKVALRLKEWPATALSLQESQFAWPAGLALFAVFLIPGLVKGLVRHRGCAEFYIVAFFFVSALGGGESGLERYATPVVPLIFYYGYLSLTVVGKGIGWGIRAAGGDEDTAKAAPRVALIVMTVFVLCNATYNRVKQSRGASKFAPKRQERARRELARWEELAEAIAEKVPADAKIYPASGGLWDIVHFLTERELFNLTRDHREPLPLFESMVAWEADYMIYDHRSRSRRRFKTVLEDYPQCFELIYAVEVDDEEDIKKYGGNDMARLYRLDQAEVIEALIGLDRKAAESLAKKNSKVADALAELTEQAPAPPDGADR
ncbi:hypothetical protein HQ560_15225, partial [bacterium]|nr:hypothetical protein [bacterium]